MDERVMQFRVGVMFLATLLITGILLVMFGKLPKLIGHYYVQVRFDYAAGVTKDTPVRKSGILIGRVSDVQLIDADSKVLVTLEIQADKKIYQNEDCYVTRDLLGDTAITFVPDPKKPAAGELIKPGTILVGKVSDDPTGLKKALAEPIDTDQDHRRGADGRQQATGRGRPTRRRHPRSRNPEERAVGAPGRRRVAENHPQHVGRRREPREAHPGHEEAARHVRQHERHVPRDQQGLAEVYPALGDDGKTPIERMVATIEMTERTMRKFSEPAREGEPAPADQIAKAMENISEITALMRSIMDRIDQGEGSVGALLNDRQLYDRLNCAAKNIEEVSYRLKPIVEDARVFMDKVARHPGVIVRDAVKPGVGIK